MKIWGEHALGVAEGANSETSMNLSGKQTHIGRNSGERHACDHRRGKLQSWREVILSGARTENLIQGILLSFFYTQIRRKWYRRNEDDNFVKAHTIV